MTKAGRPKGIVPSAHKFDWDEASTLYEIGLSTNQIGIKLGVSKVAVNNALVKMGVVMRPNGCGEHRFDWDEAVRLRLEEKLAYTQIALKLGVDASSVRTAVVKTLGHSPLINEYTESAVRSTSLKDKVLKLIKGGRRRTLVEFADALNMAPKRVQAILTELKADHHLIQDDPDDIAKYHLSPDAAESVHIINTSDYFGNEVKFGIVSDTHLGSKYERLDVLNTLYDVFAKEKIKQVYHAGNIIEGDSYFNKFDVKVHGVEEQLAYCVEHYPQRKGVTTSFITGTCHEGWWITREGIDIGKRLVHTGQEAGRKDLVYLGHVEADVCFRAKHGQAVMRIMHPGGGSPYAISYPSQKIVESWQGGEKADILIVGHHHKAGYFYPREVHCVLAACCQDQSSFLRKLKIQAHLGGFIVQFNQSDTGEINRFRTEYISFYDRKFYENKFNVS